jgi:hypothetical protein
MVNLDMRFDVKVGGHHLSWRLRGCLDVVVWHEMAHIPGILLIIDWLW